MDADKKGISYLDVLLSSLKERDKNIQEQLKQKDEFTTSFLNEVEKLIKAHLIHNEDGSSSSSK
jgi:hypothetical protein